VKAAVRDRYCSPEEIELREIEKPSPADDEVLVRVRAASLNIADWYSMGGRPWFGRLFDLSLRRPKSERLGTDFAGTVEAVGSEITHVKPGGDVFGARNGALAEYVCVKNAVVSKPAGMTFEEAAAMPVAAITALQGLRDKGQLEPGQKVLIHGASGGVGTYAVQIAKALGGEVTAVCSTPNVELARSLGADRVIDYTQEDFTRGDERYDLMLDIAGTRSWSACARVLAPRATVVLCGGSRASRLLGPLGHVVAMKLRGVLSRRRAVFYIAKLNRDDLDTLRELVEAGKLRSVVDSRFELEDVSKAFRHMGEGHPRGKIVVAVGG
jgi:NADPH:quinone reductase-like Zn-dependent oxidoreductase